MLINEIEFWICQEQMDYVSHMQTIGYRDYLMSKSKKSILYFVDDINKPSICCWGEVSNKPLVGNMLRIYGESVKNEISLDDIRTFYCEIINECIDFAFVKVSSDIKYLIDYEIGIRQAGFVRPMTLSLCPLSIILDFSNPKSRKKSWHYQLVQAKKQNLIFEAIKSPSIKDAELFVEMYKEMAVTKKMNFCYYSSQIMKLLDDPRYHLFFLYNEDKVPLAAHLDFAFKGFAYHMISANSNQAREIKGCTHYLMEQVFNWMNENGVNIYDMGRIGPSNHDSNKVYEFKKYSGGDKIQYNGEWIFLRKKWSEVLLTLLSKERW